MSRLNEYHQQLQALEQAGRKRQLIIAKGRDFSSNDYLGLAQSDFLNQAAREALDKGISHGSGGSRLLGGNHREHEALEAFAADHYDSEAALFFSSGYSANVALFSTLPQRGDLILYDQLIHASAHDGMRLGRADAAAFNHGDCDHLEGMIQQWRQSGGKGRLWIAVESLYSMDGDLAPLVPLMAIAERHDAMLVIDEAHAVGVFGAGGVGLSGALGRRDNLIILRTCGKALGVEGGLINMAAVLRDFFINRARPFIFSTAPSPLTAYMVERAIRHIRDEPGLQQQLQTNINCARQVFARFPAAVISDSQILPVILGEDRLAVDVAQSLQAAGFDVRAIRPPTVPAGTARLRISLTCNVTPQDISLLADELAAILAVTETA